MKKRQKYTLQYYVGKLVGEIIVSDHLPTLSTDMIKSMRVIEVSEEDTKEHDRLSDLWRDSEKDSDDRNEHWDVHLKNMYMLSEKYLPHVLKMRIPKFGIHLITDMEEFKTGISDVLWNSDLCSYHIEHDKIEIKETEGFAWCDYVTLHLDIK